MLLFLLQASDPYARTIATATVVTAVATVVYVIATILLWLKTKESVDITRRLFEVAHRPYIGTIGLQRTDDENTVRFFIQYVNGGTVAAHDVQTSITLIVDGIIVPNVEKEEKQSTFALPNRPQTAAVLVNEPHENKAVKAASTTSLVFKCSYQGINNQQYSYEEKFTYDKAHGVFASMKTVAD